MPYLQLVNVLKLQFNEPFIYSKVFLFNLSKYYSSYSAIENNIIYLQLFYYIEIWQQIDAMG